MQITVFGKSKLSCTYVSTLINVFHHTCLAQSHSLTDIECVGLPGLYMLIRVTLEMVFNYLFTYVTASANTDNYGL